MDVLVFCPIYRLEPETVEAIFALEWDGPISYLFQRDNPAPVVSRSDGVANHLHQYRRGREVFLDGRYDAMLVIESDIIPPPYALRRLAVLDCDLAYGCYVFRRGDPVVNLTEDYGQGQRQRACNVGESLTVRGLWPWALRQGVVEVSGSGLGCVLIRRHVLEAIEFRALNPALKPRIHCDTWFTAAAYRAGYSMKADTSVLCGHKTPAGNVLWPPPLGAEEEV
ncbi:MAG: hypothetical protein ACOC9X_01335 [bacterium]